MLKDAKNNIFIQFFFFKRDRYIAHYSFHLFYLEINSAENMILPFYARDSTTLLCHENNKSSSCTLAQTTTIVLNGTDPIYSC